MTTRSTGTATTLSGTLRLLAGITLMGGALAMGYLARSPWGIALFALAFTISFAVGRWRGWVAAANGGSLGKALLSLPMTYLVQAVLVGLLYLIGFGVAALMGGERVMPDGITAWDVRWAGILGGIGAAAGVVIALVEKGANGRTQAQLEAEALAAAGDNAIRPSQFPITLGADVTAQTFYDGIHFSHGTYEGKARTFNGAPSEASRGGDDKIAEAEARLGRQLPERLRALYRVQNGGSVAPMCIPGKGAPSLDTVYIPFSGYDSLTPLERLGTAQEIFLNFADPDDESYASYFAGGTENMIVLANWYDELLFLDYNQPGDPRVGYVDFEHEDWQEKVRWWPNFETFFLQLRHYEDGE